MQACTTPEGVWSILTHGGANDSVAPEVAAEMLKQMEKALDAGIALSASSGNGLEVVVGVLSVLEACQYFDAGYGAYPRGNPERVQLDVSLIDGNGKFYALAGVQKLIYPSRLALRLYQESNESLFRWYDTEVAAFVTGLAAEEQKHLGVRQSEDEMIAEYARSSLAELKARGSSTGRGTVGCVVRDPHGNVFAGTSTGGTPMAPFGRIGDTPIIGAGSFADSQIAALSATGHGEALLASSTLAFAAANIAAAQSAGQRVSAAKLREILSDELQRTKQRFPSSSSALIAITKDGTCASSHTTEILPCAFGRVHVGDKQQIHKKFVSIQGLNELDNKSTEPLDHDIISP